MPVPMPKFATTPIQSPGQIYIPSVRGSGGGFDPLMYGINAALSLEKLDQIQTQKKKQKALDEAVSGAYETKQTPQANGEVQTTVEFNPELYAQNLEAIDPAAAAQYRDAQTTLKAHNVALEAANLDLKDKQRNRAAVGLNEGFRYFTATNGTDQKGAMSIINPMLPNTPDNQIKSMKQLKNGDVQVTHKDGSKITLDEEKIYQIGLKAEASSNINTAIRLKREGIAAAKEKGKGALAVPRAPTKQETVVEAQNLTSLPGLDKMSQEQNTTLAHDVAQGIISLQVDAKNNKQPIPSANEARQQVLYKLEKRILPAQHNKFLGVDYISRPAMYFTSPEQIDAAVKTKTNPDGTITPAEGAKLLKEGFPEEAKKRLQAARKK